MWYIRSGVNRTHPGIIRVLSYTKCEQLVHFACSLHLEMHTKALALELQLFVNMFIRTAIVDKDFRLFEIGSAWKRSVTVFWFPDVMPVGTFSRTVEFRSLGNAHWALGVGVVHDERLSGLQGEGPLNPYRREFRDWVNTVWGSGWWGVVVYFGGACV